MGVPSCAPVAGSEATSQRNQVFRDKVRGGCAPAAGRTPEEAPKAPSGPEPPRVTVKELNKYCLKSFGLVEAGAFGETPVTVFDCYEEGYRTGQPPLILFYLHGAGEN